MDNTALLRQNRRLERLKSQGVTRSTVFVHEECKFALEGLRPHLVDPVKADELSKLLEGLQGDRKPTNVAQVRQLSPFRYPGGKTWLVPEIRSWLSNGTARCTVFVEPFAGGAMAGLTAAADDLADKVVLGEIDDDVAALWTTIFNGTKIDVEWLCEAILSFKVTLRNVRAVIDGNPEAVRARAFRTVIKNRMQRGGIMSAGAGLVKTGEAGRGLNSRWYPETLVRRILALQELKHRIRFLHGDGLKMVRQHTQNPHAFFFVDPPYTAGGKKAGKRLYTHNQIDHTGLFALMSSVRGSVMMTYDDAPEVRKLASDYGFRIAEIPMKNTHHAIMKELLILKP